MNVSELGIHSSCFQKFCSLYMKSLFILCNRAHREWTHPCAYDLVWGVILPWFSIWLYTKYQYMVFWWLVLYRANYVYKLFNVIIIKKAVVISCDDSKMNDTDTNKINCCDNEMNVMFRCLWQWQDFYTEITVTIRLLWLVLQNRGKQQGSSTHHSSGCQKGLPLQEQEH